MDHRYIEQNSVADLYLDHALPPGQRAAFEAHLVDCQECTDRVLLAEMFHNRNGANSVPATLAAETVPQIEPPPPPPSRTRFVVSSAYRPRQLFLLLAIAAMLLVLIPCVYVLWMLHAPRP